MVTSISRSSTRDSAERDAERKPDAAADREPGERARAVSRGRDQDRAVGEGFRQRGARSRSAAPGVALQMRERAPRFRSASSERERQQQRLGAVERSLLRSP